MYDVFEGAQIGALTVGPRVVWRGGTGRNYTGHTCTCRCGTSVRVRKEDLSHGKQLFCTKQCTARSPRILEDWLANTKPSGACLLWQGARTNGYGRILRNGEVVYAHREVHYLVTGDRPEVVLHKCDTPQCINPEHLESGTHRSNMQDMFSKKRQSKGDKHYKAKLTSAQVRDIRAAYAAGFPQVRLSKAYGVSRSTITAIVNNHSWKDVT